MRRAGDDFFHLVLVLHARHRAGPVERQIARRFGMNLRGVFFQRGAHIDHGGQFLVADNDQVGRVLRQGARLRDDRGDRFADITDALAGQRRAERLNHFLAAAPGHRRAAPSGFYARGLHVIGDEHGQHALGLASLLNIYRHHARMGMWRAHEGGIGLVR